MEGNRPESSRGRCLVSTARMAAYLWDTVDRPSPDKRGSPQRDAGATRQRLQRAALELFASAGYRGTTTPALARGAGVAEGTIYRHFMGKQHLYNVVYQATQAWATNLVGEVDRDHGRDVHRRLELVARRLTESAARDPAAVHMLLARPAHGLLDDTSLEAAGRFTAAIERIVAEGKAAGTVRAGPADLWATVWLEVVALALHRISRQEWQPDSPHTRQTLEAAWAAIAGAGASDQLSSGEPA